MGGQEGWTGRTAWYVKHKEKRNTFEAKVAGCSKRGNAIENLHVGASFMLASEFSGKLVNERMRCLYESHY